MEAGFIWNNTAALGVVVLANSTLNMRKVKVDSNVVKKGSIYASWGSNLNLDEVTVVYNKGFHGPGIYVVGSNATITNSTLDKNQANGGGGTIYVNLFGNIALFNTNVTSSIAPTGGAIAAYHNAVSDRQRTRRRAC
jgi:hypothetical protein